MSVIVRYHSNNSGGDWWLSSKDWKALEEAGWNVHWGRDAEAAYGDEPLKKSARTGDTFLGAEAKSAAGVFESVEEGVRNFEEATGENAAAIGCNCCGPPHSFEWTEEDKREWDYLALDQPAYGELQF